MLSKNIFPDLRVGYVHGKLPVGEKGEVMKRFADGLIDILVSTSVIEVGVNIPNASVMMIEGAERFGLAQLHQFRGRVGRSTHQSYCLLFSDSDSGTVRERLAWFEKTTDGFALAEYDLKDRGPGQVYGTEQSGLPPLRFASIHDVELLRLAHDQARVVDLSKCPELKAYVEEQQNVFSLD